MNASRTAPRRLVLAVLVSAAALFVGAASASGQVSAPSAPGTGGGVVGATAVSGRATSVPAIGVSANAVPGIAPSWCCTMGSQPGLTVVGQAAMHGQGTAARDAAIAKAVVDATDQAKTAAAAAGIQLGAIVDLQVSAMPIFYPLQGGVGGSSTGSTGPGPTTVPVPYQSTVTVTITYALA